MWSSVVVIVDPGLQRESGMLNGFEAPIPAELLLEGFDEPFTEAVLLGSVWCDVFLRELVVVDYGAEAPGAEDQAIVVT